MPTYRNHKAIICCVGLVVGLLGVDYLVGPPIRFPILYLIPVMLATHLNPWWGFGLAVGMPLVRLGFAFVRPVPWGFDISLINTLIDMIALGTLAYLIHRITVQQREIHSLRGLLPVCCFCKKIRNPDNTWEPIEEYVMAHSEARFSHSFCEECARIHYGNLVDFKHDPVR